MLNLGRFVKTFFFAILGILAARLAFPQAYEIPTEPGLYYEYQGEVVRVEGQAISFARTGSLLAAWITFDIKTQKVNAQILGRRAHLTVNPNPTFFYRLPAANQALGGSVGDLLLVRLRVKGDRRQFEIAAAGQWRASAGISLRSQYQCERHQFQPGLYILKPVRVLQPGEWGLFLFRGSEFPGFIYDFSVE
jgi:hypothetical protein